MSGNSFSLSGSVTATGARLKVEMDHGFEFSVPMSQEGQERAIQQITQLDLKGLMIDTIKKALEGQQEGLSPATRDVLAERQAQVTREGYTSSQDDAYTEDELVKAALAYAMQETHFSHIPRQAWPWDGWTFKPTTKRRNLVKAAALLLAELERLDRAGQKASGQ